MLALTYKLEATKVRELLGLEWVSLVIKKNKWRCFEHAERKDDAPAKYDDEDWGNRIGGMPKEDLVESEHVQWRLRIDQSGTG